MTDKATQVFPFKVVANEDLHHEAIKWSINNSHYEHYTPLLSDQELEALLPHCLFIVRRVEAVASTAAHVRPSLYRMFPCALSPVPRGVWQQIINDTPAGEAAETMAHFRNRIHELIAVHAMADDHHDL